MVVALVRHMAVVLAQHMVVARRIVVVVDNVVVVDLFSFNQDQLVNYTSCLITHDNDKKRYLQQGLNISLALFYGVLCVLNFSSKKRKYNRIL